MGIKFIWRFKFDFVVVRWISYFSLTFKKPLLVCFWCFYVNFRKLLVTEISKTANSRLVCFGNGSLALSSSVVHFFFNSEKTTTTCNMADRQQERPNDEAVLDAIFNPLLPSGGEVPKELLMKHLVNHVLLFLWEFVTFSDFSLK